MKRMAWFTLMQILSAEALHYPEAASLQRSGALISRNDNGNHTMTMGERPGDRTIFTVLSLFCTIVLSLLLGTSLHLPGARIPTSLKLCLQARGSAGCGETPSCGETSP